MLSRRNEGLIALRTQHNAILKSIPRGSSVAYLDYAFTTNVGDQLIVAGTLEFFRSNGISVKFSRNIRNSEAVERFDVGPDDIIVLHGGGNFGDIYPHFQKFRERVVRTYPGHRIVVMPQTVHFRSKEALRHSCELIARHPNITMFVRDRVSLSLLEPFFEGRVHLAPDMAHQLWPGLLQDSIQVDGVRGALHLIRTDVEQGALPASLEADKNSFTDWDRIVSSSFRLKRKALEIQFPMAKSGMRLFDLDEAYFKVMLGEVRRISDELANYSAWITSRLHGAILGILLGKPVFAIDNSYGKLSSYFSTWERWLKPLPIVRSSSDYSIVRTWLETTEKLAPDRRWDSYGLIAEQLCPSD